MKRISVEVPITEDDLDTFRVELLNGNTDAIYWTFQSDDKDIEVEIKFVEEEDEDDMEED
jgi:outer membrane scaffolding protein for murein synthesis (MipA/OmpV family)